MSWSRYVGRVQWWGAAAIVAASTVVFAAPSVPAATSSTVVGATVPSATELNTSTCANGTAGVTEFGSVTPGATLITTADCRVVFGSSNDTAQLRVVQGDRNGTAMWSVTRGELDADFDGPSGTANGLVPLAMTAYDDTAFAVAAQVDGRTVVAGTCWNAAGFDDFCVARFNVDGSLDVTFDGPSGTGNGIVIVSLAAEYEMGTNVAIQPDDKIVVSGNCNGVTDEYFCLMRLNVNGSLDATFDGPSGTGNGMFMHHVGASANFAHDLALQPDGRIIVAGRCGGGSSTFCLARFESNGSLDQTFDGPSGTGNGSFVLSFGNPNERLQGIAIRPDGTIVLAGRCETGSFDWTHCMARLLANGALDVTFDGPSGSGNGFFLHDINALGNDYADTVLAQPDGKVVVVGSCYTGTTEEYCLARYLADGTLDPAFDGPAGSGNGSFLTSSPAGTFLTADAALLAPDGVITVLGSCWAGIADSCLSRFASDGSFDLTFDGPSGSGNGSFSLSMTTNAEDAFAGAAQSDGRLVMVGHCNPGGADRDFCVAAFDQAGSFDDYVTGGGSDRDFASGASTGFFASCLSAVSGGAFATWSTAGSCAASDGPAWHAIPTTSDLVAYTTALEPTPADAAAHLRFALRAASSQPPGRYIAPITFDVLAP